MLSAARTLGDYVDKQTVNVTSPDSVALGDAVEHVQRSRLKAAGFVEAPTPSVDARELLPLAVRYVRPFGEKDRGFKDAMILRTIVEHAKGLAPGPILVVSNDDVFHEPEVRDQLTAAGLTCVVVRNLEAAAASLEAGLDEAGKEYLEEEAERAKAFLETRQTDIFERVMKAHVTEEFIKGQGPLSTIATFSFLSTFERVRQVRPMGITQVSRGHVLGSRHKVGNRVPITFYVKVAFDVMEREIPVSPLFGGSPPAIPLDAIDYTVPPMRGLPGLSAFAPAAPVLVDKTYEREIGVEAWLTEDKNGHFARLDIEKVSTW